MKREYAALASMPFEERAVLAVFAATAFGWVFRKDLMGRVGGSSIQHQASSIKVRVGGRTEVRAIVT